MSKNQIKESFDTLPVGICFFSKNGLPILCNTKMQQLVYQLQGKDLQVLQELRQALVTPASGVKILKEADNILYQMSDNSIWMFEEMEVLTESKRHYIQVLAKNLTRLYELKKERAKQNEELEQMIEQVQRITLDVAEVTRQQEVLTAKMRIHNKMGNCLLAARQYLVQEFPVHKKEVLLAIWKESLEALLEESEIEEEEDALPEVVKIAESIGVHVNIHGEQPKDKKTSYMLVLALRECVTNTLNHAKGTRQEVVLTKEEEYIKAIYTNNGEKPKGKIIEGGGLTSLREKIEKTGGKMEVCSSPQFSLTIFLPISREESLLNL